MLQVITKTCAKCKLEVPRADYTQDKKGRPKAYCKPCQAQLKREARAKVCPKERYERIERKAKLKHYYGITIEQYDAMLEAQGGCCAICRVDKPNNRTKHWTIDHCHDTGKVRGLLCTKCNRGLGLFNDDENRLRSAADYLAARK